MEYRVINILQTREIKEDLTKGEESVLDFLEENFYEIPKYSVMRLCEEAFTSQGTVNRVCKKLGFDGYSELKYAIKQDIEKIEEAANTNISNVNFYIDNINFNEVDKIVRVLKGNKRVIIYGLGASQITALYLQRQLLYLGFQAIVVDQERMIEEFKDFMLMIISSSGETLRVKHVAKTYDEKDRTIISLTKKDSSLYELSDYSFTHNILIDKLDVIAREQQLHIIIMVNEIINRIKLDNYPKKRI